MENRSYILYLMLLLIFLSLALIILLANQNQNIAQLLNQQKPLKAGEKAFTFAVTSITGEIINIEGKRTLLFFFSRDCPGCTKFIPKLEQHIQEKHLEKKYLVGISVDSENATKKLIAEQDFSFPIIVDHNFQIARKYHIHFVPSLVLISDVGTIDYFQHPEEKVVDAFDKILSIIKTAN